jgi:CRISPR-associated protein Cas1
MSPANTLYVTTQGSYLSKDRENVRVSEDGRVKISVPFHHLNSIVCFGNVSMSPFLMGACAERGIEVSFCTEQGRFLARIEGPWHGGSVLRRMQYKAADDEDKSLSIAKNCVLGKLHNARTVLVRGARDGPYAAVSEQLSTAASSIEESLTAARTAGDSDKLRGVEGNAAAEYFRAFDLMILKHREIFGFHGRKRRPPPDPTNALLSFLYAMLRNDAASALQAAGLDPAVGFLHVERPGRPSLALDLMEEFRPFFSDKLALSLINTEQLGSDGFLHGESGCVEMSEAARKTVVRAYQDRKGGADQASVHRHGYHYRNARAHSSQASRKNDSRGSGCISAFSIQIMTVIVSYDVATATKAGRRRLRRVAQACKDYGQRVQKSVFECEVGETQWTILRHNLLDEIDIHEDSLRFYFLGEDARKRTEHHGCAGSVNFKDALIV